MRRHEDGGNGRVVAGLMEVLQIECVVPDLVTVRDSEFTLADLELDHDDRRARDEDCVDVAADARHIEFEQQRAVDAIERRRENLDLFEPRVALRWINGKKASRRQCTEYGRRRVGSEFRHACGVVGAGEGKRWHWDAGRVSTQASRYGKRLSSIMKVRKYRIPRVIPGSLAPRIVVLDHAAPRGWLLMSAPRSIRR